MPASVTRSAIQMATEQAMAEGLNSCGFRKLGQHLYRDTGEVIHGVHFQASRFGLHDEGSFTVNLVVTWPTLYESYVGHSFPNNPATAGFPGSVRIGNLTGNGHDYWWDVDDQTDLNKLSHDVVGMLLKLALPFFDRFPDKKSVLAAFRADRATFSRSEPLNRIAHAIVAHELGLSNEADEQFEAAVAKCEIEEARQHILSVRTRLGDS